jgi:SAM-dependent methyltransferase
VPNPAPPSYPPQFFEGRSRRVLASAEEIVPWVLDVAAIRSVVDVGCGTGEWLSVFARHGVQDVVGMDGPWVSAAMLHIPSSQFVSLDLSRLDTRELDRRFDLVMCLEVAEHLPAEHAGALVDYLTALGPLVLFSAAVPRQGGTGHLNEQWPRYWIDQFARQGYECVDCVRHIFWENAVVEPWYAQNALFFVATSAMANYPALTTAAAGDSFGCRSLVHPRQYVEKVEELSDPRAYSLRAVIKVLPYLLRRTLQRRLGWTTPGKE